MNKSETRAFEIIEKAYKNNRLHHAILLYGPSLNSLEYMSKKIANIILNSDDCDKHPDFFKLRPEGKSRQIRIGSDADRVGGQWPPNTMRWLLNKLRQSSNANGNKLALIIEADRMNVQTANAFLKTLEEPPPYTFIIMISQRPNDLLDTIKSRCISIRIESLAEEIENEDFALWLSDFEEWIKNSTKVYSSRSKTCDYLLQAYGLLSRFDKILEDTLEENSSLSNENTADMDKEMIDALETSQRKALRKNMLVHLENSILNSASSGEISISKLSRCIQALEESVALTELNMKDIVALEYFMLSSIRILFSS